MSDRPNDVDPRTERQLAAWLRDVGKRPQPEIAGPLARTRAALLEQLDGAGPIPATSPRAASRPGASPQGITRRMVGALAAAAAVVLLGLLFASFNSGKPLSAMERTAQQLRAVTSYSYVLHWESSWLEQDGKRSITSQGDSVTSWEAPSAFHNEMVIKRSEHDVPQGNRSEKVIEHFVEVFPAGQPGLLIDYVRKTWLRQPYEPTGSSTYPWDLLRMIREGSYTVQQDLGVKRLKTTHRGEVEAQGFVLLPQKPHTRHPLRDPVELWVDRATNLPIEFSYRGKNAESTYFDRATDFRWNIPLDPKLFVPVAPAGFVDITPPSDARELAQIAAALRLFAEWNGGRFPPGKSFDAGQVYSELLKLAGFAGDPQPGWKDDPKYQRVAAVRPGLERIERVLRLRGPRGYRGDQVRSQDKQQVLLWWGAANNQYQVFYGDLRNELLSEAAWMKLIPAEERTTD